jgi:hypothetical protein
MRKNTHIKTYIHTYIFTELAGPECEENENVGVKILDIQVAMNINPY